MTEFAAFIANCKLRYDFADRFQVRYQHANGEAYDTWVSGEETLARLRSEAAEERLRGLAKLDRAQLEAARERLPELAKERLEDELRRRLGDVVEDNIGGNVIGDSLADAVRGRSESQPAEAERWRKLLQSETFRLQLLELAWIQLEGSIPDEAPPAEPGDWLEA
ncbi:MAG: hypothetical protein ACRDHL_15305 [Candidatus Promineifilaceae bacterium]